MGRDRRLPARPVGRAAGGRARCSGAWGRARGAGRIQRRSALYAPRAPRRCRPQTRGPMGAAENHHPEPQSCACAAPRPRLVNKSDRLTNRDDERVLQGPCTRTPHATAMEAAGWPNERPSQDKC